MTLVLPRFNIAAKHDCLSVWVSMDTILHHPGVPNVECGGTEGGDEGSYTLGGSTCRWCRIVSIDRLRIGFSAGSFRQCGVPGSNLEGQRRRRIPINRTHSRSYVAGHAFAAGVQWSVQNTLDALWTYSGLYKKQKYPRFRVSTYFKHDSKREAVDSFVFIQSTACPLRPLCVHCTSAVRFIQPCVLPRTVDCKTRSGRAVDLRWIV